MTEEKSESIPHVEHQQPSATLIIPIESTLKIYDPDRSGNYSIPDRLRVRSENAAGKIVTITYNVLPEDPDYYEFRCIYKGTSETSMPLLKCVDPEGRDLGQIPEEGMLILEDRTIRFESNSDELKADAIFEVRW